MLGGGEGLYTLHSPELTKHRLQPSHATHSNLNTVPRLLDSGVAQQCSSSPHRRCLLLHATTLTQCLAHMLLGRSWTQ